MARKTKAQIRSVEQLRVLAAPATFEVFEALQSGGPATAAELGPRLGRKANSLHYHLRKRVRLKMVEAVASRRSGARTEAVYDVTASSFEGATAPKDLVLREATTDAVASLLRLATRNYARAAANPDALTQTGRHRNIAADRRKAWLTKSALVEVNTHIRALHDIFAAHREAGRGELCALTTVLTPLSPHNHASGRDARRNVR